LVFETISIMIRLGFVSAILPELSLEEVLRFASEINYRCVEVMCWPSGKAERRYAGVTHIDVTNLSKSDVSDIRSFSEAQNVSLSGLGYYPNILCADREEGRYYVDHLKKVIIAAERIGLDVVNTFIGSDPNESDKANFAKFVKVWPGIIKFAEKRGIRIGIENCPMYFTADEWPSGKNLARSPALWRRIFERIPSQSFGLNYDPSHMIWQQMDYLKPIREFSERFVHVHAKDVRLDRERLDEVGIMAHPLEYHSPKLPGLGDVDWGKFFSVLGDSGYSGSVCVEVEDRAYEASLENRKESLRQSFRYLSRYVSV
jgi:sugar phosphate isomerase/epimerase